MINLLIFTFQAPQIRYTNLNNKKEGTIIMIDIHCHLLPGIDDGSENLDISLQMARDAVADGITHALLTPHHMNGHYINHATDVVDLTNWFQAELDKNHIPLTVFPSQEVRINGNLLSLIDNHDILTTDEQGQYILIEFPSHDVPAFTKKMLFNLQERGLTPVIVHPERNTELMAHPELLYDMVSNGAYSQITASSYVGTFGKAVQKFSEDILDNGLTQIIASDAHHLPDRTYEMSDAFAKLKKEYGSRRSHAFDDNAKALINGDPLIRFDETPIKKKKFFSAY